MNMNEDLRLRDELDVSDLLLMPRFNKLIIKGVESHYDVITAHVILMHGKMTSLLGPLMYQASKNLKVKNEVIADAMVEVLQHLLVICEACEYEIPTNDDLVDYDMSTSNYVVRNDSILTLTDMCMAVLDIIHVIHVDMEGMTIWSEEEVPEDIAHSIKLIIIGIKNLGKKHDFTLRDIISRV